MHDRAQHEQRCGEEVEVGEPDAQLGGGVAVLRGALRPSPYQPCRPDENTRAHEIGEAVLQGLHTAGKKRVQQVEHDVLTVQGRERNRHEDEHQHQQLGDLDAAGDGGAHQLAADHVGEGDGHHPEEGDGRHHAEYALELLHG
jgi:hypothetical protein